MNQLVRLFRGNQDGRNMAETLRGWIFSYTRHGGISLEAWELKHYFAMSLREWGGRVILGKFLSQ